MEKAGHFAAMHVSTLRLRRKLEELTGSCAWMDCSCGGESTPAAARYSSSVLIVPSERLICAGSDIVFGEIKKLYQVLLPSSCTLGGEIYTYLRSVSKTWKRGMTSTFRTVHVTYSCQTTYPLPHILPRTPTILHEERQVYEELLQHNHCQSLRDGSY
jgi:hypothetical protein